jgi:hypothetical protein
MCMSMSITHGEGDRRYQGRKRTSFQNPFLPRSSTFASGSAFSSLWLEHEQAAASRGSPSSLYSSEFRSLPQIMCSACQCTSGARGMLTGLASVPPHYYGASRCSSGKSRCTLLGESTKHLRLVTSSECRTITLSRLWFEIRYTINKWN